MQQHLSPPPIRLNDSCLGTLRCTIPYISTVTRPTNWNASPTPGRFSPPPPFLAHFRSYRLFQRRYWKPRPRWRRSAPKDCSLPAPLLPCIDRTSFRASYGRQPFPCFFFSPVTFLFLGSPTMGVLAKRLVMLWKQWTTFYSFTENPILWFLFNFFLLPIIRIGLTLLKCPLPYSSGGKLFLIPSCYFLLASAVGWRPDSTPLQYRNPKTRCSGDLCVSHPAPSSHHGLSL